MNKSVLTKLLLVSLAVLFLFSSCYTQTPGALNVAGIRMGASGQGAMIYINLAVAEVGLYLGNYVGIGIIPLGGRPLGLVSPFIPWVPGVTVQLLPVLFRNVTGKPYIGFLHLLIIKIGI
jgi:hypothetical protein